MQLKGADVQTWSQLSRVSCNTQCVAANTAASELGAPSANSCQLYSALITSYSDRRACMNYLLRASQ